MKKFLVNLLFFVCLYLGINKLISLFVSPYHGNPFYLEKYNYFAQHQDDYNTLILGSSRVYRHIKPNYLDELLKDYETSTFNLAAPSTFNPEAYYLYEKLLNVLEKDRIKYVFLELQSLDPISRSNINTRRNYYWHNWKYLNFAINYTLNSNMSLNEKTQFISVYSISYLVNKTRVIYDDVFFQTRNFKEYIENNQDGFYAVDRQMADSKNNNMLKDRMRYFLENTHLLKSRIEITNQSFSKQNNQDFLNKAHLNKINYLIKKSKEKNIHLVFIIPPRLPEYDGLIAIKEKLPKTHIIEIANPEKYPELYQIDYSFDIGHLNSEGAKIFTKYLADEFIDLFPSNPRPSS